MFVNLGTATTERRSVENIHRIEIGRSPLSIMTIAFRGLLRTSCRTLAVMRGAIGRHCDGVLHGASSGGLMSPVRRQFLSEYAIFSLPLVGLSPEERLVHSRGSSCASATVFA